MPLKITLSIGDEDLKHFRAQMRKAQAAARQAGDQVIIDAPAGALACPSTRWS